jgi:CTP:molybdopterin cytidylyltransferase MocA
MGSPKGLCRLPGDRRSFLERIVAAHRQVGHAIAVATTDALHLPYAAVLSSGESVRWILGGSGRGTGDTVAAAARELANEAERLWLHPVDLPLVSAPLLVGLQVQVARHPEAAIVPECHGEPGHPVILPALFMASLREEAPAGSLRAWLLRVTHPEKQDRLGTLVTVTVTDRAVVTDFDEPVGIDRE